MKDGKDKIREGFFYLLFGGLSTLVNVGVFYVSFEKLGISNVPSVIIAWLFAVIFAFITNKIWVFGSKSFERKTFVREAVSFFGCRILTGLLDVFIMYLSVDVFNLNAIVWKVISNLIVIVLNYIASKLLIFRKKPE